MSNPIRVMKIDLEFDGTVFRYNCPACKIDYCSVGDTISFEMFSSVNECDHTQELEIIQYDL